VTCKKSSFIIYTYVSDEFIHVKIAVLLMQILFLFISNKKERPRKNILKQEELYIGCKFKEE